MKAYPAPAASELGFRRLAPEDVPRLTDIETQGHSHPWSENVFKDCFGPHYAVWGIEWMDHLQGFAVLNYIVDEVHLLNICVARGVQGRGLGRRLLRFALGQARQAGAGRCILEVRVSNQSARALYVSEGFEPIGVRREYYPGIQEREDALVYALTL
ncbi:ribosomal protein S18-alanine N-acetyltransferase [Marinobacteraceae bacterium S3BR75-40.1]